MRCAGSPADPPGARDRRLAAAPLDAVSARMTAYGSSADVRLSLCEHRLPAGRLGDGCDTPVVELLLPMKTVQDYAYLWDGSQKGWVLLRINRQSLSLTVIFGSGGPTLRDVASMRSAVPTYGAMPPSDAFAALKGKAAVALGTFNSDEGRRLRKTCAMHGLEVLAETVDLSSYLPFNEATNRGLLIEDDRLAQQVREEALARGVLVKRVEA